MPLLAGFLSFAPPAEAQQAPQPPSSPDETELRDAKRLFREGNALRKAGDYVGALQRYQQSRELVPSVANTLNAAYCLERLERLDEALDLYEELLTQFGEALDAEERAAVVAASRRLREAVGALDLSANVDGILVIDGRMRGKLPLTGPVRLMPGEHVVRVIKDGYAAFEQRVGIRSGDTAKLDAVLHPLASAGRLRVASEELQGGQLYVDGALVGELPWEGTLSPGRHVYWVQDGPVGTAPTVGVVVEGQTALVTPEARPLGPPMRLVTRPRTAALSVNGVVLGSGSWEGRLPVGEYLVEATEEGYLPAKLRRRIVFGTGTGTLEVELEADPSHPRWATPPPSRLYVDAFGGAAFGEGLGSQAEDACEAGRCEEQGVAGGWLVGARAGYEFPFRLAVEVGAGYLDVSKRLRRNATASFGDPPNEVVYRFDDDLRLRGPVTTVGLAYRLPLGSTAAAEVRLHAGAMFGAANDPVRATATANGTTADAYVTGAGEQADFSSLFVVPGARVRFAIGRWAVGAGVLVPYFFGEGPDNEHGATRLTGCDPSADPNAVTCAPAANLVQQERLFGSFWLVVPTLSVGAEL